jgi:hypothetical protein
MKLCKLVTFVCLFVLAAVPAYCQHGTFGIDLGQTTDRFGDLSRSSTGVAGFDGEVSVYQSKDLLHGTNIVVGGETRFPLHTDNHATEFAFYGGPVFHFTESFSASFHAQLRQAYLPASVIDGITYNRYNMRLLELPLILQYKFGPSHKAFVQAEAMPEFTPHMRNPSSGAPPYPHPLFDHGYTLRGVVGYNFGRWYAKATYESRYFRFQNTYPNPYGIYNWRTDLLTGGVGFSF